MLSMSLLYHSFCCDTFEPPGSWLEGVLGVTEPDMARASPFGSGTGWRPVGLSYRQ
jgi:hypothetical protein